MATADRPTLFINATVLDGSEHMEPQPDMAVTVERGVITWIGPSAVAQAPAGAEVIDLGGAYLMPGLINMHVHLCGSGKPVSAGDAVLAGDRIATVGSTGRSTGNHLHLEIQKGTGDSAERQNPDNWFPDR